MPVDGEVSYKPVEGGFFIEGRFERRFAGAKHVGISMLGAEPDGLAQERFVGLERFGSRSRRPRRRRPSR